MFLEQAEGFSLPSARRSGLGGLHQLEDGKKACYYPAVCLETGEAQWMEL